MTIRAFHASNEQGHRNICLIPSSAHGTNPASAVMAGLKVVVVKCDDQGNVDIDDLQAKAEAHKKDLAAIMVTYPSTHGVFEETVREVLDRITASGAGVVATYDDLTDTVLLERDTVGALPITLSGDTSGLRNPFSKPVRQCSRVISRRRASVSVSAASAHTQMVAWGAG